MKMKTMKHHRVLFASFLLHILFIGCTKQVVPSQNKPTLNELTDNLLRETVQKFPNAKALPDLNSISFTIEKQRMFKGLQGSMMYAVVYGADIVDRNGTIYFQGDTNQCTLRLKDTGNLTQGLISIPDKDKQIRRYIAVFTFKDILEPRLSLTSEITDPGTREEEGTSEIVMDKVYEQLEGDLIFVDIVQNPKLP